MALKHFKGYKGEGYQDNGFDQDEGYDVTSEEGYEEGHKGISLITALSEDHSRGQGIAEAEEGDSGDPEGAVHITGVACLRGVVILLNMDTLSHWVRVG